MTQENTGTITNKVRIGKYTNDYGSEDIDNQNNESQADVIVSVRTGRIILYISLAIIIIMIIAVGVYFIKKKFYRKEVSMKKLIVTIIAMLFAVLCIPNCSRKRHFILVLNQLGGIYTAMRNNGSA